MALSKRSAALLAGFAGVACRALGAADSECAAGSPGCANDQDSLLQVASNARESNFFCNKNSLIIGPTADDTFLQWNLQLMSQGAPYAQFLNCIDDPSISYGKMFAEDIALVNKRGKPNYGIVLVHCASDGNLLKSDSAKLKEYLDAGGLLVVSQSDDEQTTALLEDLGSSIRQENWPNEDSLDCGTAADPPYVPSKTSGGLGSKWCPMSKLVEGVTGMQGSNLDAVVDDTDSSVPLFAEQRNATYVVARAEKKRRLVVIGDDESVDDDCATKDGIQALAFGVTTNLRFFSNLYNSRCMAFWY